MLNNLPKLIRPEELSERLGVRKGTIYSWVRRGVIPCVRLEGLVRFDLEEISNWIKDRKKASQRKANG